MRAKCSLPFNAARLSVLPLAQETPCMIGQDALERILPQTAACRTRNHSRGLCGWTTGGQQSTKGCIFRADGAGCQLSPEMPSPSCWTRVYQATDCISRPLSTQSNCMTKLLSMQCQQKWWGQLLPHLLKGNTCPGSTSFLSSLSEKTDVLKAAF